MTITLYINNSDTNVVDKNLDYVNTLTGNLRRGTSLLYPTIDIEADYDIDSFYTIADSDGDVLLDADGDSIGIYDTGNIFNVNYIYVTEFKRYYYVTNIDINLNNLFSFVCRVDVLTSHKDKYLTLSALISRNQYAYNANIEDDKMTYEFKQSVNEYTISQTSSDLIFDTSIYSSTGNTFYNYIITLQTDYGNLIKNNIPAPNSLLPSISDFTSGKTIFSSPFAMTAYNVDALATEVIAHSEYASYIISLVCLPFKITDYDSNHIHSLAVGSTILNSVECANMIYNISPYYRLASFEVSSFISTGTYLDKEPYTTYELYLPYYGYVELKSSDILDSVIEIYYSFDYTNASAKINIYNKTKNYVIKSLNANIGVNIAINRTNQQQLNDERTQLAIKSAIGTLGSLASIGVGAYTYNPYMIASGVSGLASTAIDIGEKLALQHESAYTSNNTGKEGLYGVQVPRLKVTRYIKKEPTNYANYYGLPTNTLVRLDQLNGYTLVKDIHLDGIDATKTEIDELYSLLTSGIIL